MTAGREEELLAQLEQLIVQVDAIAEQTQREDAERDQQREEAARDGALGPDWQEVQRRIDRGETTLRDVFGGTDESPAAVRLRGEADRNLTAALAEEPPPAELLEEIAGAEAQWQTLQRPNP